MELFEQIRRDRDREGLSTRALAVKYGVHRRAVRQALASPVSPVKRSPVWRPAPKLGEHHALIDAWLEADRDAPRKQRHTARRVWQRLVEEHGAVVSERQVSRYVRARRRELGDVGEAFVPQQHEPGAEAEVDWGDDRWWASSCAVINRSPGAGTTKLGVDRESDTEHLGREADEENVGDRQ
jgi:transposase